MISRNLSLPGALASSLFLLLASSLPGAAAEAGAWETFSSADNAAAWLSFDYGPASAGGGQYYSVDLDTSDPSDPFVTSYFVNASAIDFSTRVETNAGGDGKLVGDYAAQSIQGVEVDVFVPSLPNVAAIYLTIYQKNDDDTFSEYDSLPYTNADLGTSGWHRLRFGFEEIWSLWDGVAGIDVVPGDQFFKNVFEMSFVFVPTTGTSGAHTVGIDNVKLEPKVTPPVVTSSIANDTFTMTFTPGENLICDVERWLQPAEDGWELIDGHIGITGTTPHVFTTPVLYKGPLTKEFFHVWYEPIYDAFVTPPSGP